MQEASRRDSSARGMARDETMKTDIDAAKVAASAKEAEPLLRTNPAPDSVTGLEPRVDAETVSESPKQADSESTSAENAELQGILQCAEAMQDQSPNSYTSWRSRADVLVSTIRKLEKREISPDSNIKIFAVPLVETELRDAAEKALRHCAHFANTFDERISLVDAANDIRNISWF